MNDCIFCKLANGIIPVEHVLSNEHAVMITDKNPIAPQHLLVMTKKHFGSLDEMNLVHEQEDKDILIAMFKLIDDYVGMHLWHPAGGYRILTNKGPAAGQTVKHLHFHLLGGATLKNDFGA